MTTLVEAEVDGEGLTDDEILVFFGLLIFAGNDTTRNTMAGGMLALLEHPDQLELLRAEPERIEAAVEEILRWTSVVKYFCRTATADAELGGLPDRRRREDRHALPGRLARRRPSTRTRESFQVKRAEPKHMAFGGGGRHFCLGAGLARLELRVAFEEILSRWGEIRLAGEPERLQSDWANALTSLPIEFTRTQGETASMSTITATSTSGLTDEQLDFREAIRDFAKREVGTAEQREKLTDGYLELHNQEIYEKLAELGWLGVSIDEEYGGAGQGMVDACIFLEETMRGLVPIAGYGVSLIVAGAYERFGTEEQKNGDAPRDLRGPGRGDRDVGARGGLRRRQPQVQGRASRTAATSSTARRPGSAPPTSPTTCWSSAAPTRPAPSTRG